jgi:hypothetical protein
VLSPLCKEIKPWWEVESLCTWIMEPAERGCNSLMEARYVSDSSTGQEIDRVELVGCWLRRGGCLDIVDDGVYSGKSDGSSALSAFSNAVAASRAFPFFDLFSNCRTMPDAQH